MISNKLDHAIEKMRGNEFSTEQKLIKELTGKVLPKIEAKNIWLKVLDHKWYISERLRRDVGLRVAAVDYMENFYEQSFPKNRNFNSKIRRAFAAATLAA